ncbi:MAG: glycosyltransferase family 2 protein [Saccharofermentanales bacterium]
MFFSIIIPTYNRAGTLRRTIESLLKQTFDDFEAIIVDDGSTDGTEVLVSTFRLPDAADRLKYIHKKNGGKYTALNTGIQAAAGDWLVILDSDDYLIDTALEEMAVLCATIADDPLYCGIMGRCRELNGKTIGKAFPSEGFVTSYIDFHFVSGYRNGSYGDCTDCLRTSILKKYRFPEQDETKFVPEAYIMDQIGLRYKLLCTNRIWKVTEYSADGITRNKTQNFANNPLGYLLYYKLLFDEIFPAMDSVSIKLQVVTWWKYWNALSHVPRSARADLRCRHVTAAGWATRAAMPVLNALKRK